MDHIILIILSGLVIFSYLFELFSKKSKIPAVLLLLFLGIGIHYFSEYLGVRIFPFHSILPTIGTIGLILIVFEGALELKYERKKLGLIIRAFLSALLMLLFTALGITWAFVYLSGYPVSTCFLNAIPFSIISSSIAIPSVAHIMKEKREFIIYESSFSDILGIMLFNFASGSEMLSTNSFLNLGLNTIYILVISAVFCVMLLFILGRISHHVKFFLIISILILVYAVGKEIHLSSLVIVLVFGLFLNNIDKIQRPAFRKTFIYPNFKSDLHQLYQLSAESAFLLRTFFFVIFGYTININNILNEEAFLYAGCILGVIYVVRFIFLKTVARTELLPELFITPRGLISILLFYSIADAQRLPVLAGGVLFQVIIITTILMTFSLLGAKRPLPETKTAITEE